VGESAADPVDPVQVIDCVSVRIRDGQVANQPIYVAMGISVEVDATCSGGGVAAVAFEVELAFDGVEDRFDHLTEWLDEALLLAWRLTLAAGRSRRRPAAQVVACPRSTSAVIGSRDPAGSLLRQAPSSRSLKSRLRSCW